jgi:uncharacterized protein with von Willebrand factor type A (vWA) domain
VGQARVQGSRRQVELGTRNIKVALRRLRKFAREGAPTSSISRHHPQAPANQGYLDVQMRPERRNAVKVLMFFDIGGSMDWHIKRCEELFSAARTEFKHLESSTSTTASTRACGRTTAAATSSARRPGTCCTNIRRLQGDLRRRRLMSPYEITMPGGSVEHWNEEAGQVWLERVTRIYQHAVWLNPVPREHWDYTQSIPTACIRSRWTKQKASAFAGAFSYGQRLPLLLRLRRWRLRQRP